MCMYGMLYMLHKQNMYQIRFTQTSWIGENIKQKMLKWQMLNVQKKNIFCSI